MGAPDLSSFQKKVPGAINTASNTVNHAVAKTLGPTNSAAYSSFNTNIVPNVANNINKGIQQVGATERLPQTDTDFIGGHAAEMENYVKKLPAAVSAYRQAKPWLNDYNTLKGDYQDGKHSILPITKTVDNIENNVRNTIYDQALGMSKQYQDLKGAAQKFTNFGQVPFWRRVTGLHNQRPVLNTPEFQTLNTALGTPGLTGALAETAAQNYDKIPEAAKDIANPVTVGNAVSDTGSAINQSGKLLNWIKPGLRLGGLARTAGPLVETAGGTLAGAGTVGNVLAEANEFSKNYDWDKGPTMNLKNYMADMNSRNAAGDFLNVPSYANKVINNIYHPGGAVATATYDAHTLPGDYGQAVTGSIKNKIQNIMLNWQHKFDGQLGKANDTSF